MRRRKRECDEDENDGKERGRKKVMGKRGRKKVMIFHNLFFTLKNVLPDLSNVMFLFLFEKERNRVRKKETERKTKK